LKEAAWRGLQPREPKKKEMIMSSTSNAIFVREAGSLPARARSHAVSARISSIVRQLWRAYWDYQARRATIMLLHALDDRALADIGFNRSEIESAVFASTSDRLRRYDPKWRLRGKL
jgi:uncharacterized protein YjiS (DUF1127 family)